MFLQEDSFFFKFQNNHLGFGTLAYSVFRKSSYESTKYEGENVAGPG